jgi:hypothetical protein
MRVTPPTDESMKTSSFGNETSALAGLRLQVELRLAAGLADQRRRRSFGESLAITMSSGVNSLPRKPWFCMCAATRRTFWNSGLYM